MAVRVDVSGNSGTVSDVDGSGNLLVRRGPVSYGNGGAFTITGGNTSVSGIATAGAILISLRHSPSATTNLYITRLRILIQVIGTTGTPGPVGLLGWQRFSNATPTGGSQRFPRAKNALFPTSQLLDARDLNAGLTKTGVNLGDVFASCFLPPLSTVTNEYFYEWIVDLAEDELIRLTAGDGIGAVVQSSNTTQSWGYTYSIHYLEI